MVALAVLSAGASPRPAARRNGLISFGTCCSPTGIYLIRPNGTGERRLFSPKNGDAPPLAATTR